MDVEMTVREVDFADGPVGFAIITDISERRRAEAELRRSSVHNRCLIEASVDPLVTIGPDGKITDVNAATELATGCSRAELIGTDFADYFTEPDQAQAGYQEAFREGVVRDYALEIRHRNGHTTPVVYNAAVYRDEAGQVIGVFAAARDITAQKRAEAELRRASGYNRRLIEASLDPLVTIGPDGKITDVNTATERATGCSRAELIGTDFADYFTEPDQAQAGYQEAFREGVVHDYALEIRHRNGHTTPVVYNAAVYRDEAGQVNGVFAAARDITTQKRAEQELIRSNAELEQFAYVASHDLQEPLRAISGLTQLLAQRYQGRLDEKADRYISLTVDGCQRMQQLIHGLLAYSRLITRGRPLEPVDSEAVLERSLGDLQVAIAEAGAVVTHDRLPTLTADATQLGQLFQNLIGNALKFRNIAPPRIHVSARGDGEWWTFDVADNGIGIDPQYAEQIFAIFQRLHTRDEYPGTGIGLAICKKIVERHGGRIWVESQPGQGSTFRFTLPTTPLGARP
jgi:PAS domain S-box-containing protein